MRWLLLLFIIPYIYILVRIYLSLKNINRFNAETNCKIFVSVIAACRNEEKELPGLLSDIADQIFNHDLFELIIVDDNSTDSTLEIASGFKRIKNLKVLKNTVKGKKGAIRTGVDASDGALVITTDADCRMGNTWLKTIVSYFAFDNPDMIICPVKLESSKGFFRRFQELEFLGLQGITAGTAADFNPVMCNGANLAFKKESYLKHAGNLHEELLSGDDIFLLHNIKRESGNRILWLESDEAIVTTRLSDTLFSFFRQRARWISKSGSYNDIFTVVLAIVTFVTISVQILLLVGGIFLHELLLVFGVYSILKSFPDFLILFNTSERYGKKDLMKWFLPSQLVYPFYVLAVVLFYFGLRSSD